MYRRILSALLGATLLTTGLVVAQSGYVQPFTGAPPAPLPYRALSDFDITVHSRDSQTFTTLEPMTADHGTDCSPPPATHAVGGSYDGSVFQCLNHVMTAIMAGGYGVIYLTPPAMLDWSAGPATLSYDMSTLRTSQRDWVDLWVSPFTQTLQLPLDIDLPDLEGPAPTGIHIKMDNFGGQSPFIGWTSQNFVGTPLNAYWWIGLESMIPPSAAVRTPFQLQVSRTHVRFGLPGVPFWWIDQDVPDLGFDQGVVQLGHHSYNPLKDCAPPPPPAPATVCAPNTWHWDNVALNPAAPFTILRGDPRVLDATTGATLTFPSAAPAGAFLRFALVGTSAQISLDGGATWQAASAQPISKPFDDSKAQSYWTAIPAGTTSVQVRAQNSGQLGTWQMRDASIWAQAAPPPRTPTPTPAATPTATLAPPATATAVPPTATPALTATPTPVQCERVSLQGGGLINTPC